MDVILDTNIFVHDFRMEGTQFQELFRYMRRTDSSLVLPKVVFQEAIQKYRDLLSETIGALGKAWANAQRRTISAVGEFSSPVEIEDEVSFFKKLLKKPASRVKVYPFDDYSSVDLEEVVRRGVERARPANADGEELRDVILWLMVLAYAKKKHSCVAFISDDATFQGPEGNLNETLAADLKREKAEVSYYKGISAFITANSLETEVLNEQEFFGVIEAERISEEWGKSLRQSDAFWGAVREVGVDKLQLATAKKYRVAKDSFYVEALLRGDVTVTVAQRNILSNAAVVSESFALPYSQLISVPTQMQTPPREAYLPEGVSPIWLTYPRTPSQNVTRSFLQGWGNAPYTGGVLPNILALTSADRTYRCSFELDLSARVEGDKLSALQIDDWKIVQIQPMPTPSQR